MFKCVKTGAGFSNVPETCYFKVKVGEEVKDGMALVLANGYLTKATTKVEYIALKDGVGEETIPVMKVSALDVYETTLTTDPSSIYEGDKLALTSDGLNAGAKSESGAMTVVKFVENKVVGAKAHVIL
ncbi:MAG: hypothetical protein IJ981_00045 [Clostridia bacterium]|nr:hypothetical protein [Clostridia bacterium]MBR2323737.1 hypothetical protein [Clostridia bacterium]